MDKSTIKLEAYKLLQTRQISEDRILVERTNIYLLTNSFLFAGYATLACCLNKNPDLNILNCLIKCWDCFKCLEDLERIDCLECLVITIPILGIILGLFLMIHNFASCRSLHNWHVSQEIVEGMRNDFPEDDVFSFMVNNHIAPEKDGHQITYGNDKWVNKEDKQCRLVRLVEKLRKCISHEKDNKEENTSSNEEDKKKNSSLNIKYSYEPRKGFDTCFVLLAEFIRENLFQWLLPFIVFALWGVALKVAICLIQP